GGGEGGGRGGVGRGVAGAGEGPVGHEPVRRHQACGDRGAASFHVSSFWHGASVASMTTPPVHRAVRLERIENGRYVITNDRGGQISIGSGQGIDLTPVDLLLAGIGGCTAADVDALTSRRAGPVPFEALVDADKAPDGGGPPPAPMFGPRPGSSPPARPR